MAEQPDTQSTATPAARPRTGRWTALLVVAAFVAPIGIAWWFVYVAPPAGGAMLNRGALLEPPLDIHADPALAPLGAIPLAPGEWAMIWFGAGPCADACRAGQERLAQVYRVLGHDQTRVHRRAVAGAVGGDTGDNILVAPALTARLGAATGIERDGAVVFLDWRGRIMIAYGPEQSPGDIKKDLKRLLRASKIK